MFIYVKVSSEGDSSGLRQLPPRQEGSRCPRSGLASGPGWEGTEGLAFLQDSLMQGREAKGTLSGWYHRELEASKREAV